MGARKSVKKAPAAKKAAGGRKKTAAKKKAAAKRAPAKKAAAKQVARKKPATPEPKISSLGVNMGHVLALRPRLRPSFRPEDFKSAKLFLQDETYQSIEQAARAVAEKALELTHEGPPRHGFMRRR